MATPATPAARLRNGSGTFRLDQTTVRPLHPNRALTILPDGVPIYEAMDLIAGGRGIIHPVDVPGGSIIWTARYLREGTEAPRRVATS